jgi:hypothetical protein
VSAVSEARVVATETGFPTAFVGPPMTRESELMLYFLLGIPAVVVGFVLLTMGPIGWFLAAFLGIAVLGAASVFGDDADGDGPERVNCPACGSRTDAGGACAYCGEAL